MKTINYILGFIIFINISSFSQVNCQFSNNYSAVCKLDDDPDITQTSVFIQNDSIIIEDVLYNQCCPQFALCISEVENDTLYVTFTDTASIFCTCMCYFDIIINAGKFHSNITRINYNGKCHSFLPHDYKPLIQVGKKWNSLRLIPGLENTQPTLLEHTIDSNQTQAFCWNGKFYHEVKAKYIYHGDYVKPSDSITKYIREENGKVYIVDQGIDEENSCDEALIYDFTLDVGDTVTLGFEGIKYVAVPIEISEIQGRRCIALADLTEPEMSVYTIWIEGVGDLRGLFNSTESLYILGATNVLTCCGINDTLIYQNEEYPDCGIRPPYQFFIQEGKTWTTVTNCFIDTDTSYTSEVTISENNMQGNPYAMRFYPDTNYKDYYYQEENRKVYYNQEDEKFLIYDFTKNSGDSIKVGNSFYKEDFNLYVDSVNYIKYEDNNLRKTLYLSGDMNAIWIEGIGDIKSPLESWIPILPCGCVPDFACCSLNGELLYQNPLYPNCGKTSLFISNQYNQIKIFPNPTNGLIEIQGLTGENRFEYVILNILGKVEQKGKIKPTIYLNLNDGLYLLKIKNGIEEIKIVKLVIKR